MKRRDSFFNLIRVPVDIIMIMGAFVGVYTFRPEIYGVFGLTPDAPPVWDFYLSFAVISTIVIVLLNALLGSYNPKYQLRFSQEAFKITSAVLMWFMGVLAVYVLILHDLPFSRLMLGSAAIVIIIMTSLGRLVIKGLKYFSLKNGYGRKRLLFIGFDDEVDRFISHFLRDHRFSIQGILHTHLLSRPKEKTKIIGIIEDFEKMIGKNQIDQVICHEKVLSHQTLDEISLYCLRQEINYTSIPHWHDSHFFYKEVDFISGIPVISYRLTSLEGWKKILKRIFDFFMALGGLILLSPLFLTLAILIKLDSKGPVFYISRRVGKGGKIFPMVKFRSMVQEADRLKKDLLEQNHRSGPLFKIKNDPRVTKLGKFLRRTSLDELPQLFNILRGEMSLVGPRPHLPEEVAKYEKHHQVVLAIQPGITGLAQISGRSDLDFEEEVRLDRFYIEHWSFFLDLSIILKTLSVIFGGKGAD